MYDIPALHYAAKEGTSHTEQNETSPSAGLVSHQHLP